MPDLANLLIERGQGFPVAKIEYSGAQMNRGYRAAMHVDATKLGQRCEEGCSDSSDGLRIFYGKGDPTRKNADHADFERRILKQ